MPKISSGTPTHSIKLNHGLYNPRAASMPLIGTKPQELYTVRANAAATETLEKPPLPREPPVP